MLSLKDGGGGGRRRIIGSASCESGGRSNGNGGGLVEPMDGVENPVVLLYGSRRLLPPPYRLLLGLGLVAL